MFRNWYSALTNFHLAKNRYNSHLSTVRPVSWCPWFHSSLALYFQPKYPELFLSAKIVTIYIYMYNYALIANIREKELIKQKRKWRSICTEIENVPVLCLLQNSTNIIICRYVIFAILKTVNKDKISHQLKIAMTQFCYYFWIDNALHLPL